LFAFAAAGQDTSNVAVADAGRGSLENPALTAVEAAFYLGTPNVVLAPDVLSSTGPVHQFALSLSSLSRVIWPLDVRAGDDEVSHAIDLLSEFPNFEGFLLHGLADKSGSSGKVLAEMLTRLRTRLTYNRLWASLDSKQFDHLEEIEFALQLLDTVVLWDLGSLDQAHFRTQLQKLSDLAPAASRLLASPLWDSAADKALSVPLLRQQCTKALELLRGNQIDGILFLPHDLDGPGLPAAEWVRHWIRQVGDQG
jgi:hypothetical protein